MMILTMSSGITSSQKQGNAPSLTNDCHMKSINLTIMQKCKILFFFFREAEAPFSYQPKLNCDLRHIVEIHWTLPLVLLIWENLFLPLFYPYKNSFCSSRFNMDIRHIKITSTEGLYRINEKKAFKGLIVSLPSSSDHNHLHCELRSTLFPLKSHLKAVSRSAHSSPRPPSSSCVRRWFSFTSRTL